MITYRVEFTLARLAGMAVAKRLWMYKPLKDLLEFYFKKSVENVENILPFAVTRVVGYLHLPDPVKEELLFSMGTMGWQIWDLFRDLGWVYSGIVGANHPERKWPHIDNYMDHVHWRNDRCLVLADTIRSLYYAKCLPDCYLTWVELSRHCLEDCMRDLWPKLWRPERPRSWKDLHDISEEQDDDHTNKCDYILQVYWVARMHHESPTPTCRSFRGWNNTYYAEAHTLSEIMMINAFIAGNYSALLYFWNMLDGEQRLRLITHIGRLVNSDSIVQSELFLLKHGRGASFFLLFFLEQLTIYQLDDMRIDLLGWGFILAQLLNWPYDNLFLGVLKEALRHHNSIHYGPVFANIFINIDYLHQFIQCETKYYRLFCEIWRMNPPNLRKSMNDIEALSMLEKLRNVRLYNFILGDQALLHRRKNLLSKIVNTWARADLNFEKEFIENVLISRTERQWFQSQVVKPLGYRRRL
ncbi:uncharacterized protein LOC135169554 [Diachasmimorpha longicaudata]|uniref:uncharacterized protein LOC135169554 n=1 Tax=Diachasmimorpha longicaudata TaxID=58733 RepID=UPI0030B8BF2D